MRKLIKKLRSKAGEGLIESLASVLIFTFSSIILLSLVAAATKLNISAKQIDKALADELYIAEAQSSSVSGTQVKDGSITISFSQGSGTYSATIPVVSYSKDANSLYSFAKKIS